MRKRGIQGMREGGIGRSISSLSPLFHQLSTSLAHTLRIPCIPLLHIPEGRGLSGSRVTGDKLRSGVAGDKAQERGVHVLTLLSHL